MKNFFLLVITVCVAALSGFAEGDSATTKIKVEKGIAQYQDIKYPVFTGITVVESNQFGGIQYSLAYKKEKQAMDAAKKIMKFYTGKSIGRYKLKKFQKVGKPDTVAWYAANCGETGAEVVVSVAGKEVQVRAFNNCIDLGMLF
jgi:hypothetical protein